MNRFEPTTEDIKKPEAQENHEASRSVENPEELRQQMITEAEKETDQFKQECANDLSQVEARVEKDGLRIDSTDKEELQSLNKEADDAKLELETALMPPLLSENYRNGSEKIETESKGEKAKFCHECGKPVNGSASFCTECGARLMQRSSENTYATPLPLFNTPPPLPQECLQATPPHLSNTPPLLPENYGNGSEKIEDESRLFEYLQKSKIKDPDEALKKLMDFAGVNSKSELLAKLDEKDEYGDNIIDNMKFFSPETLDDFDDSDIESIQKVKNVGDVLGYTYMNTSVYKNNVDNLVDNLRRKGRKEDASEVENIFKNLKVEFENEKNKSDFERIDENLLDLHNDEEKFRKFVDEQKNLPPDAIVHLYHGLNSAGYEGALVILNGESKGVEQGSGPTLSLTPSGGFWKGVGFRYALRRYQIEFPGEKNANAVVRMWNGQDGIPDTGVIINESGNLPLDQFEADVMRSKFTLPNPDLEKELVKKLQQFKEERDTIRSFEK